MGHKKKRVKQSEYEQVNKQSTRHWLKAAAYVGTYGTTYKGHVQQITDKAICFDRLFVEVDYCDGGTIERGKEDHVWVEKKDFFSIDKSIDYALKGSDNYEKFKKEYQDAIASGKLNWICVNDIKPGDNLEFFAEAVPYERANGTKEYGLQKVREVHKISDYELPTDEELLNQAINGFVCEVCMFRDHCNGDHCLRDDYNVVKTFTLLKSLQPIVETDSHTYSNDYKCVLDETDTYSFDMFSLHDQCVVRETFINPIFQNINGDDQCAVEETPYELQEVPFEEEQAFLDGKISVQICDKIDELKYQNSDTWNTPRVGIGIFGIVDSIENGFLKLRSIRIQPLSVIRKDWNSFLSVKNISLYIREDVLSEKQLLTGDLVWFSCESHGRFGKYASDNLMKIDRNDDKITQITIAIVSDPSFVKISKQDYCEQCNLSDKCGGNCMKFEW